MDIITFIGNCQIASLCFYFQQLLDCNINYVSYGDEMTINLYGWSNKINNKIVDYDTSIELIKNSNIIVYQEISKEKSLFCNTEILQTIKMKSCRLIKLPSIYLDYSNYDISIEELKYREITNKVDIIISDIFQKYKECRRMLTINHPNTFLFLEIVNEVCKILDIDTFPKIKRDIFLQNNNYMGLFSN